MPAHRRYTKREKTQAVAAATMTSAEAASETLGIPRRTIGYWLEKPEFAELRHKTREDLTDEFWATIQVGLHRMVELIPATDDLQKVSVAVGILYDKHALLSGGVTQRTESRDLTDVFDDHEKSVLGDAIRDELARRADERAAQDAVVPAGEAGAAGTDG